MASLGADDAARLLSRIRKPGTATLKVVSHPQPHYLYDLVRHYDGAIPQDPSYRPRPGDLARIDEEFRNTKQDKALQWREDLSLIFERPTLGQSTPVPAQGTLTSWVSAGADARWISSAAMRDLYQRGVTRSYTPRSTTREYWFSPIQHPRLLNDGISWQAPYRVGDIISTSVLPAWGTPAVTRAASGSPATRRRSRSTRATNCSARTTTSESSPPRACHRTRSPTGS
ncbi:hypothetical protein ACFQ0G_47450 [Streptomyces chiangmaiensis]